MPYRRSLVVVLAGTGFLALPLAAQSIHASPPAAVQPAHRGVLQPTADLEIGGHLDFEAVRIPAGVTVWVTEDLQLSALGDIVIDGALVARPTAGHEQRDGVSLSLSTPAVIRLGGTLSAGDGAPGSHAGQAGGRGGDLTLRAAVIETAQDLLGGRGGDGGPSGDGGAGGNVFTFGDVVPPAGEAGLQVTLRGGDGGHGGAGAAGGTAGGPGGAGGSGGSAAATPGDADGTPGTTGAPGTHQILSTPGADGAAGGPCGAGINGTGGANATGGSGGNGGPGGAATSPAGTGGKGGTGGIGGFAVASGGGDGGDAGGCCFLPDLGIKGGTGGRGGIATAGNGGNGGFGGAGGAFGVGGDGGLGGNGGSATGGSSGDGGRGGDGSPAGVGGGPGVLGVAFAGTGGAGGLGGPGGLGSGLAGPKGTGGNATPGLLGATGPAGTFCLDAATWTNTGFGLAGHEGKVPELFGFGNLLPGTVNSLSLFKARPSAPCAMFLSVNVLAVKFKGGWLIPAPDLAILLSTTPTGDLSLPFVMPNGPLPPVILLYVQIWIQDPAGLNGFAASNSLRARIP